MRGQGERHEITVLFGPCTGDEAEALLEKVAGFVYDDLRGENLGAVCALHPWDDPGGPEGEGYDVSYRRGLRRLYACGNVEWREAAECAAHLLKTGRRGVRLQACP